MAGKRRGPQIVCRRGADPQSDLPRPHYRRGQSPRVRGRTRLAGAHWTTGTLHLLVFLPLTGTVAVAVYGLALYLLRVQELSLLAGRVRARLGRA